MLNTVRIIKDIKELVNNVLKMEKGSKQILTLVLRFDGAINKEEILVTEFVPKLWSYLDKRHSKFNRMTVNSIAVQDQTGTLLYDSMGYLATANRSKLSKKHDTRVKTFSTLSQEERERTVDILCQQIWHNKISPSGTSPKPKTNPSGWDDFLKNLD